MGTLVFPPMPRHLTGVIFDCDGVLIDSRAANATYYNRVRAAFHLPPMTAEQEAYTFMATARQALLHIVPPEEHHRLEEVCRATISYSKDILPLIQLEKGVLDFVRLLRARGVRCAVHTNRAEGMQAVLDRFALRDLFDPVVTACLVPPKPAPDGVLYVLRQWKAPAAEVLFVGDSCSDARTAAAGGVPFVAFGNDTLDATLRVSTFEALRDILCAGPLRQR